MVAPPSTGPPSPDPIEVGEIDAFSVPPPKAMKTVVVALDGSAFGESALGHARTVADAYGSRLHLVHVLDPGRMGGTSAASAECRLQQIEANGYLERLARDLDAEGIEVSFETREGTPENEIVAAAFERDADLVVLASRPRLPDAHLVSRGVAQGVIATGIRSLLVARGGPAYRSGSGRNYRRIAVAVDGSRASHRALRTAEALARGGGARLVLVHVLETEAGGSASRDERERYLRKLAGSLVDSGIGTEAVLRRSDRVAKSLEVAAREGRADLLVMGARGAGATRCRYGRSARALLLHGEVPLLVVRGEAKETSEVGEPARLRHGRPRGHIPRSRPRSGAGGEAPARRP